MKLDSFHSLLYYLESLIMLILMSCNPQQTVLKPEKGWDQLYFQYDPAYERSLRQSIYRSDTVRIRLDKDR